MSKETEESLFQYHNLPIMQAYELVALATSRHSSDYPQQLPRAKDFMTRLVNIDRLPEVLPTDLFVQLGLDKFEAIRFKAAVELGRKSASHAQGELPSAKNADEIFKFLRGKVGKEKQEHFFVLTLDSKLQLIRDILLFKGTLNVTSIGIREIIREAVKDNSYAIVIAHNHPSGNPTPSPSDIEMTRQIKKACDLLEIDLVDHIIFGDTEYFSMQYRGLI